MQLKDYQQRVLDVFDAYLEALIEQRYRATKIAAANALESDPDLKRAIPDFPRKGWDAVRERVSLPPSRAHKQYSSRKTGDGQDVPNATLKVPTGGGKTLLATACVGRIVNKYLASNTGLVLWIVPNEAIYSQTRRHLTDRDHPYRQMLDRCAAGRVKILHKESPISRADVDGNLCVLLLMLQSANRQTKDTLRLFRDRGNVHGFTPPEGDAEAHDNLAAQIANLDVYRDVTVGYPQVKDSLGNVLRMIRPVVVMDEGHKAFAPIAYETLYGFNPCFVLELSATPKDGADRWANLLVDVRGTDLDAEEMIKMPINLTVHGGDDWRDCLRQAWERTQLLQREAELLGANTARYIRPILLVQVERTGKEQREAGFIHAEDAREHLESLGLPEAGIAVKTAEVNDLKDPERQDLLSPLNQVRAIITKQALQEGWDCPFAYVLCSLAASNNMSALTQLVGRILRQPDAQKTGIAALDECYVHCFHAHTGDVVKGIKAALEQDGMGDLIEKIRAGDDGKAGAGTTVTRHRRSQFAATRIFLPRVLRVVGGECRALDWERDILFDIDWTLVDVSTLAGRVVGGESAVSTELRRIGLDVLREPRTGYAAGTSVSEAVPFDAVYATRSVSDIVPNAWIAYDLVGNFVAGLQTRGWSDTKIGQTGSYLIEELRSHLAAERDRLAEGVFRQGVANGQIQFRLRTDKHVWALPDSEQVALPERPGRMMRRDGREAERSLMEPVYAHELNGLEYDVACYLDTQNALSWWYRNVVRESGYALQGWRRNRVYPDFLLALQPAEGKQRLVVLETKGNQLAGNLDTEYKRALMKSLTEGYRFENGPKVGELELDLGDGVLVSCDLVQESGWKTEVAALLAGN